MNTDVVRYDVNRETGIATIVLAQPEKLNALTEELTERFNTLLTTAQEDSDVRAIIITGEGRGFCSGLDMEQGPTTIGIGDANPPMAGAIAVRLQSCEKPTVAAINGIAVGAGLDIALACDFRIAAESARLGDWHVNRGIVPSAGLWYLPRLVGIATAYDMVAFGTTYKGSKAEEIGLIHRSVSGERLMEEAREYADRLARGPQATLRHIKILFWQGLNEPLSSLMEDVAFARAAASVSKETEEGARSFDERREPDWRAADRTSS